ncbi:hypothetical protein [Nocardioides marmoribigeumensis]|uniref:DUF2516 family protein n=1 Tax=Nocardioides marmoribigeumensis TaxID=433649 RepID=A0ABU2BWZ2_9ACTN|nr:hypothetical protein [Nocardioides marmoribigeumensis]MDR7362539.1 hypothetical protein [Nocardioides marmoribigeumensis]
MRWEWGSPLGLGIFAAAAVLLVSFVAVEARAAEPVLPLWIFRRRVLNASSSGAFVVGVLLLGLTSYVPLSAVIALALLLSGLVMPGDAGRETAEAT